MKKINFNKGLKAIAITFFLFFSINSLKAQPSCSYNVKNNGSCSINVIVVFMSSISGVCTTSANVTISAYSTQNFSCGGCVQPLMDVIVTLNWINTTTAYPLSGGSVNASNTTDSGTLNSAACNGQLNYDLNWNSSSTNVDY